MVYPKSLESLINYYKKLPGIGEKNAERLALATLNFKEEDIDNFAKSLDDVKKKIRKCEVFDMLFNNLLGNVYKNVERRCAAGSDLRTAARYYLALTRIG